jgi:hypothetical protein
LQRDADDTDSDALAKLVQARQGTPCRAALF